MQKSLFSAAILAAVFGAGFAFAGQTTGTIKTVDDGAKTVTLEDGTVYSFNDTTDKNPLLGGYLTGDEVRIVWDMMGDKHEALAMSPDFSGAVNGKIKDVNAATDTVELEDGKTFSFRSQDGEKIDLSGFTTGNEVAILPLNEGGKEIGRSIATHHSDAVTGIIEAINAPEGHLTLKDGVVVKFDAEHLGSLDGFKVGDNVKIDVFNVGSSHWGNAIAAVS